MKKLILAIVFLVGCNTVPEATEPTCPVVTCGWAEDFSCPEGNAFSSESSSHEIDDGATVCWIYTAACVAPTAEPVSAECIPEECKQNRFTTCSPKAAP